MKRKIILFFVVLAFANISNSQKIALGGFHSLLVCNDSSVLAWGSNDFGESGLSLNNSLPFPIPNLSNVISVASGFKTSFALKANGTVWSWGFNGAGNLGNGTNTDSNLPVQVSSLSNIIAISAGEDYAFALREDSTVWSWGRNLLGQLGNGTNTDSNLPAMVFIDSIIAISSGGQHCLALKSDGTVWSWGYNLYGQLGNGNNVNINTPIKVNTLDSIVAISAGAQHSFAIRYDGTVWCWGRNLERQLGNGTTINSNIPIQNTSLTDVRSISGSANHSLAIKNDGTVWSWGTNNFGQLGNSTNTASSLPVNVTGLTSITSIAPGPVSSHSIVIKNDGTLWAWGRNSQGQLGNGTYTNINDFPLQVSSLCYAVSINVIQTFNPNRTANLGTFVFEITGAGFNSLSHIKLQKDGEAPIIFDSVLVLDNNHLQAIVTLNSAPLGNWQAIAFYDNQDSSILMDALKIENYEPAQLSVSITGNPVLRVGFNQIYTVSINNSGNVDAYFPVLMLGGLPIGTQFEILADSLYGGEDISIFDSLQLNWDSIGNLNYIDSITMTSFYMLQPYKIPARSVFSFNLIFHIPNTTILHSNYNIKAIITKPMYTSISPEAYQRAGFNSSDCWVAVGDLALQGLFDAFNVSDWLQCASGNIQLGRSVYELMKNATDQDFNQHNPALGPLRQLWDVSKVTQGIIETGISCMRAIGGGVANATGLGAIQKIWKFYDHSKNYGEALYNIYDACIPNEQDNEDDRTSKTVIIGNSWDPNTKTGIGSNSEGHYCSNKEVFNYSIQFENDPFAAFPAQKIKIIDTLNISKFDLSTFSFTSVTLGYKSIALNNPLTFQETLDFSQDYGVNARITGQLDKNSGIVTWVIRSIDPVTNQPTTNPSLGILPPNILSPNGQGAVSFKIKLLPAITNGDTVGNKATIIFDDNPPILTPVWQNIIDTIKPESHVDPLPITNNSDTIFLHWTGSDNGPAGLYAYNIYYNVNGGPWLLWRINTSAVIDTFIAVSNGIYSFYSRAIDSAFNIEDNPSGADATTTIGSILPVKLLSFFVKKESKQNILSWKTSHETTTDRFEIQRSTNGWEFAAIGNTKPNLTFDYIYHDRNPVRAINYYRLKTIDKDGRFQFSPIRSINNTDQSLIIYPNPVTTKRVSVYGLNAFEGGYVFELYTMEGKLLFIHEGVVSSSILNVVINLPSFISQGSYIMKMKNKNNAFHQLVFVK